MTISEHLGFRGSRRSMLETIWTVVILSKQMTSADMLKSSKNQSNEASVVIGGILPL
jgi:hypothetical protein